MSEMIDRVATALEQSFKDRIAASAGQPFEATGVISPGVEVWQAYARAAVSAMREPTFAMEMATDIDTRSPLGVWLDLIDEALK